jgi:ferric-dicitrate binding protein FerR (iron transport regulator)
MSDKLDQDPGPLDEKWLDGWKAPTPSAGFADRVMNRWEEDRAPRRRNPMTFWAAAAVLALVVGSAGLTFLGRSTVTGATLTAKRESISLGNRGIAVAEAESALSWNVNKSGEAAIEQSRGNVFYRVERGEPFVVRTPAGTVEVKGTCFRVEVSPMKSQMISAGAGAALAATVMVTVYEGKVLFANERGRAELTAGQRSAASSDRAPTTPTEMQQASLTAPSEGVTREELLLREKTQREEVARLEAKVRELEQSKDGEASNPLMRDKKDKSFVEPTKEELLDWAKQCRLKWDSPGESKKPWTIGPDGAQEYGLSETERAAFNQVSEDFHKRSYAQLLSFFREATGDSKAGEGLSPWSLYSEIGESMEQVDIQRAFQRISRERAGLAAPPTDASGATLAERFVRFQVERGNTFEKELGAAIGPDLAHAMRLKNNGWGSKSSSSPDCPK